MEIHNEKSYRGAEKLFEKILQKKSTPEYFYYRIKNLLNWSEYVGRSNSVKHVKLLNKAKVLISQALQLYRYNEKKSDFELLRSLYYGLKGYRKFASQILARLWDKYRENKYYRYLRWKFKGNSPNPFDKDISVLIEKHPRFFKARFDRARYFFNHGILHIATSEARYCWRLKPKSPWATTFYGVCILEHNEPYRAILYFKKVLRIEEYSPAIFEMGRSLYLYGKLKKSLMFFNRSVELNPGNVPAHFYLGKSYMILRMREKAIFHFKKYILLNPSAIDIDDVKRWVNKLKNKIN